jgi:tRNA (guanine-N7-)-methyltransferase
MTKGQQRALEELFPQYGLSPTDDVPVNFEQVFGRCAPRILEIGFGDGGALFELAVKHPEYDFIGIEVHRPGVGSLLLKLEQAGIHNVRVFCADGVEVLESCFEAAALERIHLFFPDPWHKKKHHKRRILTPKFIDLIVDKLKPGGIFHFATDWQDYAEQAMERLEACKVLINQGGENQYSPRPDSRPETKFERRGHRLGHGVWDIIMRKQF